jgi:septal ring factor EnvC (AmiA/AmiB activator)
LSDGSRDFGHAMPFPETLADFPVTEQHVIDQGQTSPAPTNVQSDQQALIQALEQSADALRRELGEAQVGYSTLERQLQDTAAKLGRAERALNDMAGLLAKETRLKEDAQEDFYALLDSMHDLRRK